jgi:hypothetical protein
MESSRSEVLHFLPRISSVLRSNAGPGPMDQVEAQAQVMPQFEKTLYVFRVPLGFANSNLRVRRLQADEIWCFVGAKAKNVTLGKKAGGMGRCLDVDGIGCRYKVCVSYLVGGRDGGWAKEFMQACAMRIKGRVQITTDGHKAYLEAVENAFGADIDYAQLQKIYGAPSDAEMRRYSPAKCIGADQKVVSGDPDPNHVSTSYVERHNLTMRMSRRRFTRLTNGFSKKVQNHAAMVAVYAVHYNFARVHKSLRITPAMAAGLSNHVWSLEEIVAMADAYMPKPGPRGPYKKRS